MRPRSALSAVNPNVRLDGLSLVGVFLAAVPFLLSQIEAVRTPFSHNAYPRAEVGGCEFSCPLCEAPVCSFLSKFFTQ